MKILIICSAGEFPEIGTGHFYRMYEIAKSIKFRAKMNHSQIEITFAGNLAQKFQNLLQFSNFKFHLLLDFKITKEGLLQIPNLQKYDVAIIDNLDINFDLDIEPIVIAVDNPISNSKIDISIFSTLSIENNSEKHKMPAFPEPLISEISNKKTESRINIFCSFGGFDPKSYTRNLIYYLGQNFKDDKLNWSFFTPKLPDFNDKIPSNVTIVEQDSKNNSDFYSNMQNSDLAVVSGGLTMFQSLYLGKPTLVIPQYEHQFDSAKVIADRGACCLLKHPVNIDYVYQTVLDLVSNKSKLEIMSIKARSQVPENFSNHLANIFVIYEYLEWDSNFFGFPIARITTPALSSKIMNFVINQARRDKVRCIYFLDSGNSYSSLKIAAEYNFNLVDTRMTFEKCLVEKENYIYDSCRVATTKDLSQLEEISKDLYVSSRYYFDKNFDVKKCEEFYTEWITKSINGLLDDLVIVHESAGKIDGFVTVKFFNNYAHIGLIGVDTFKRNKGIGRKLLSYIENFLIENNIFLLRVVTQGRNVLAQKLYVKSGFIPKKHEYWHHLWLD